MSWLVPRSSLAISVCPSFSMAELVSLLPSVSSVCRESVVHLQVGSSTHSDKLETIERSTYAHVGVAIARTGGFTRGFPGDVTG